MNTERRTAQRIEYFSTARIHNTVDGSLLTTPVETKNISISGLFLETDSKIPIGTDCTVEVELAGEAGSMFFTVQGQVSRNTEDGLGIAFTVLDNDSYGHILNLITLHEIKNKKEDD